MTAKNPFAPPEDVTRLAKSPERKSDAHTDQAIFVVKLIVFGVIPVMGGILLWDSAAGFLLLLCALPLFLIAAIAVLVVLMESQ